MYLHHLLRCYGEAVRWVVGPRALACRPTDCILEVKNQLQELVDNRVGRLSVRLGHELLTVAIASRDKHVSLISS